MARISTQIEEGQDVPDVLPTQHDGTDYPYLLFAGNQMHASDNVTDLIGAVIAGYDDIEQTPDGNEDALWQRYLHAVAMANFVQKSVVAQGGIDKTFDLNQLNEDDINALLQDRGLPVSDVDKWNHDVPLVLIATDYAPFGTLRSKPEGNVLWIDPSLENKYLQSLSELGLVNFYIHEGEA